MSSLQSRWLVGKTISEVDMNPRSDGRGGTAHDPVIKFTDGSCIQFRAEPMEDDSSPFEPKASCQRPEPISSQP